MTPVEMLTPAAAHTNMDVDESAEPSAKRQKYSVMRVGDEVLCHMDIDNDEYMQDGVAQFSEYANDFALSDIEMNDFEEPHKTEMSEDDLWQPFSQSEPELDGDRLQKIDDFADSVEIQRLFGMSVLCKHDFKGGLGTQLSAKVCAHMAQENTCPV